MLLSILTIELLKNFLDEEISQDKIIDYRIFMNLNSTLSIVLVQPNDLEIEEKIHKISQVHVDIEIIDTNEYEENKSLFNEKIDMGLRKRLNNLINPTDNSHMSESPVVTFYSYKGGVGRTTSLITFANWYAYKMSKKVVVLDLDFEAPGLTNYFDFSMEDLTKKSGVAEYLLDYQASKTPLDIIQKYMIEVSNKYTGDGSIYIMPAGNLYGDINLNSYLESIARIDINSTDTIVAQIEELINHISEKIQPDIILIDSRTGFNDILGFLMQRISNTIVGFFEDNIQTKPGLNLFLKNTFCNDIKINTILVNSLVHKTDKISKRFRQFKDHVNSELSQIFEEENLDEKDFNPLILELKQYSVLGNLGTQEDDSEEYLDFIKEDLPKDYDTFFNEIIKLLPDIPKKDTHENESSIEVRTQVQTQIIEFNNTIHTKKQLLQTLLDNFPKVYGEDTVYNDNFIKKEFYFRDCMADIFNYDKFLLVGGKGTGKTTFYNALKNEDFFNSLQKKANRGQQKYKVIDVISMINDRDKNKYFPITQFSSVAIQNPDDFYKRFWIIYIVNSILLEKDQINYSANTFSPMPLKDDLASKKFLLDIINSDEKFIEIEKEINNIELFLKKNDLNLLLTFDQLDFIVQPRQWSEAISPLIMFCRSNTFIKLQPKLFIRRDLYSKLGNLTNEGSLNSKSINLEWTRDEVFGFLFKTIFAFAKDDFFKLMMEYAYCSEATIDKIKTYIEQINRYNQIPLEDYYVKPLVETFFGKYANAGDSYYNSKYGTSYDWLYKNLINADGTISLRPFLDLIKKSIELSLDENEIPSKGYPQPILPAYYYVSREARKISVERHFEDLAKEKGNEDFANIIRYIHDNQETLPRHLRKRVLKGDDLENFMKNIIENGSNLSNKTTQEIEDTLVTNGVVKIEYIRNRIKECSFSYLYKYYLGLKG